MKHRIYAIILLVIMVLHTIKPVIPFIQYAALKDYIAANLCINKNNPKSCCYGKCYLEKQLAKNSENTDVTGKNLNQKSSGKDLKEYLFISWCFHGLKEVDVSRLIWIEAIVVLQDIKSIYVPPETFFVLG